MMLSVATVATLLLTFFNADDVRANVAAAPRFRNGIRAAATRMSPFPPLYVVVAAATLPFFAILKILHTSRDLSADNVSQHLVLTAPTLP